MIHSLEINNIAESGTPWWASCTKLPQKGSMYFEPGLNIIFSQNGDGKSTILAAIAHALQCLQGGVQVVTPDFLSYSGGRKRGILPRHDGGKIVYFDPGKAVGLLLGLFDYDFLSDGVFNSTYKGSSGMTTLARGDKALRPLFQGTEVPELRWKADKGREKDLAAFLEGNLDSPPERKIPTILLDEPDRSLSLKNQALFWRRLVEGFRYRPPDDQVQVIVATHSIFALGMPVNYIELSPGEVEDASRAVRSSHLVSDMLKAAREVASNKGDAEESSSG